MNNYFQENIHKKITTVHKTHKPKCNLYHITPRKHKIKVW